MLPSIVCLPKPYLLSGSPRPHFIWGGFAHSQQQPVTTSFSKFPYYLWFLRESLSLEFNSFFLSSLLNYKLLRNKVCVLFWRGCHTPGSCKALNRQLINVHSSCHKRHLILHDYSKVCLMKRKIAWWKACEFQVRENFLISLGSGFVFGLPIYRNKKAKFM